MFPKAIEQLFKGVQRYAQGFASVPDCDRVRHGNEFFHHLKRELDAICEAVSVEIGADSCAAFFVTEDLQSIEKQQLRMRGASGQLAETLEKSEDAGLIYTPWMRNRRVPGLTQIAWQCGLARWANTREEMENLRSPDYTGLGDKFAYSGDTLKQTFRNCVIVPIFAPGRVSWPPSELRIDEMIKKTGGRCPLSASEMQRHMRFLCTHRVVGLLKAENKKPRLDDTTTTTARGFMNLLGPPSANTCSTPLPSCPANQACRIKSRCRDFLQGCGRDWDADGFQLILEDLSRQIQGESGNTQIKLADGPQWGQTCRCAVDHLIKTWDATFSSRDVELLVAVAMLLGRILPWRTIQCGSTRHVVLDENEVGSLLICPEDIEDLVSLRRTARQIGDRVVFLLKQLQSDLAFGEQRKTAAARKRGVLAAHSPIREVSSSRTKTYASLFRKAIRAHDELWDTSVREYMQKQGRGLPQEIFTAQTLVRRLLGPRSECCYDIRDVCGVRITCDYLSDIAKVIHTLACLSKKWRLRIRKIDNKLGNPDASGYRSVHLDLLVNTTGIVSNTDIDRLKKRLGFNYHASRGSKHSRGKADSKILVLDDELWFPCEVQIRTAYEDSWAEKSHELVYKLDRSIAQPPKTLEDFLAIMSNNLFETDHLSDIVQQQIQEFLVPELGNELRLKELLRERFEKYLQGDALGKFPVAVEHWPQGYLMFAIECARELYRRNIKYGGTPYYVHALSSVIHLIERFELFRKEDDGTLAEAVEPQVILFVVTMLHDCWLAAVNEDGIIDARERARYWQTNTMKALKQLVRDRCRSIVEHYDGIIDLDWLYKKLATPWVDATFEILRSYWQAELGDATREGRNWRAAWHHVINRTSTDDYRDLCRLRAALLIERLEELPDTPNLERRRERLREAWHEFRQIRNDLQGTKRAAIILAECYRTVQTAATQLGVEIPIHWYE